MLEIEIPGGEEWNEATNEFVTMKSQTLLLEHSLVSLSKWESKWCKAFLSKKDKTAEETLDYIKCMTVNKNVDDEVYNRLTQKDIEAIDEYIGARMSATYVRDINSKKGKEETVTSELIYYWMITANIPFECQKWHLNRLIMLIKVCAAKNGGSNKKMSKSEIMRHNAQLNAARRKQMNTTG